MKEKIIERALQIAGIAAMIAAGLMAFYAIRVILWVGFCLGCKM